MGSKRCLSVIPFLLALLFVFLPHAAFAQVVWTPTADPAPQDIAFGSNQASFSSVNIGTPSSQRIVVVGVGQDNHTCPVISLSVNGIFATEAVDDGPDSYSSLWYINVTSGTTANIVVTCPSDGAFGVVDILVGTLTGASLTPTAVATHPTDSTDDPQAIPTSGSITVPTNGVAVVFAGQPGSSGDNTVTWTGATGDYYVETSTEGDGESVLLAHSYTAGSDSFTVSGSVGNGFGYGSFSAVVAAWGPGSISSAQLQIDGENSVDDGGGNTTPSITLTTAEPNDIVVVQVANEAADDTTPATVSSIADTDDLVWHERSATTTPDMDGYGPGSLDTEVWWAYAPTPLSSDTITATMGDVGGIDCIGMTAFGVYGANTSDPWDTNISLPAIAINEDNDAIPSVSPVSTNAANTMLLGFWTTTSTPGAAGDDGGSGYPTAASGYTQTAAYNNIEDCSLSAQEFVEDEVVSQTQSNVAVTLASPSPNWFMVGDAIQGATQPSVATGRIIRIVGGTRLVGGIRLE